MSARAMRLPLLALSLAVFCSPSAFAQNDATPDHASGTLIAQADTLQFMVYFGLDQATLDDQARATIASAAQEYQRTGQARISVRGHTDTSGNAEYNQALSQRREQAVTDELIRLGVPSDAVTGDAVGEADLAVATGDGVREAQNRRVEITVAQPPPPPPEPAPAPEPAPPVATAPPIPEPGRGLLSVGPFYGYNLEDLNGGDSHLAGLNISFDYAVTPLIGVGVEQAGFYHFGTENEGFGGRSAASLNLLLGGGLEISPYFGGNIGYLYGSGIDEDFFAGPEVGIMAGNFLGKVAYDIPFNRDFDEGIIATTIAYGFRF